MVHSDERLRILLLADQVSASAKTIADHMEAIRSMSRHNVKVQCVRAELPDTVNLEEFDCVLVHYNLVLALDHYVSPRMRRKLRAYQGVKGVFLQDEYRFIDATKAALKAIRADIMFTTVQPDIVDRLYPDAEFPSMMKVPQLTGYVPGDVLAEPAPSLSDRPVDIGYRARKTPAYLGKRAQEKWEIAEFVRSRAENLGLTTDISCDEKARIYGDDWGKWLRSCRAVLGAESAISVCDFDGSVQKRVERYMLLRPSVTFDQLSRKFFADLDGRITISVISPRIFEAAAARTLQILYEGQYSGVLEAWRHYIPLKKDHSNFEEVIEVLKDSERAQRIVDQAYEEIALDERYSFGHMVRTVDSAIEQSFTARGFAASGTCRANDSASTSGDRSAATGLSAGIEQRQDWRRLVLRLVERGLGEDGRLRALVAIKLTHFWLRKLCGRVRRTASLLISVYDSRVDDALAEAVAREAKGSPASAARISRRMAAAHLLSLGRRVEGEGGAVGAWIGILLRESDYKVGMVERLLLGDDDAAYLEWSIRVLGRENVSAICNWLTQRDDEIIGA